MFIRSFILGDVASDKLYRVTSVISSAVPFKIVLQQKGLTVDGKSPGLGLLVSQSRKTTTFSALGLTQVAPRLTWWILQERASGSSNVPQRASASGRPCSAIVAQMEQREDLLGKKEHVSRAQGWARWDLPAGRHRYSARLPAQAKEKQLIALLNR